MENAKNRPPVESKLLQWLPKNLKQLITYVKIHPWELLGKWVKYNKYVFIYVCLFWWLAYRLRLRRIFTRDGSNSAASGKGVPFGVRKLRNNIKPLKIPW